MNVVAALRNSACYSRATRPPVLRQMPSAQPPSGNTSVYPDIYYIILDTYTRSDVLRDYWHTDNSDFINFLQRNGFSSPAAAIPTTP